MEELRGEKITLINFIIDADKLKHVQALIPDFINAGVSVKLDYMEQFQICVTLSQ